MNSIILAALLTVASSPAMASKMAANKAVSDNINIIVALRACQRITGDYNIGLVFQDHIYSLQNKNNWTDHLSKKEQINKIYSNRKVFWDGMKRPQLVAYCNKALRILSRDYRDHRPYHDGEWIE